MISFRSVVTHALASSPLRHPLFRMFYFGTIGSALGYTMQATVAAWLMATLTTSALMVALVQTASTAPALLFGLVAGALADIVDRRRVIFATHIALLAATAVLGLATLLGWTGPALLLALTLVIGGSFTFYLPAQQASVNELVGRSEIPRAVALGAVAFNVARAVGPALAGAVAALLGTGSAMLASALFFVVMMVALRRWHKREFKLPGIPETLWSGVQSGLRFARHSPAMRALIVRNLSFSVCASAFWALLPVIARDQFALGAGGYGLLSAAFGTGAVVGALAIPPQLQRKSLNWIVTMSVVLWMVATVLIAVAEVTAFALVGALGAGMAWVGVFASLSAGAQSAAPAWVRARALAVNLVAVQASLALGSVIWGVVASAAGTRTALLAAAGTMALLHLANRRLRVEMGTEADVTPGLQLPEMTLASEPLPDDGPILIQIEYRVAADDRAHFLRAVHAVEKVRRRNGASSWRVFRDLGEDGRFVERFVVTSWGEYVRLRTRMTVSDRKLLAAIEALQKPGVPLGVSRFIGIDPDDVAHRA